MSRRWSDVSYVEDNYTFPGVRVAADRARSGARCYNPGERSPRGIGLCADDPSLRKGQRAIGADGLTWKVNTRKRRNGRVDKYWMIDDPDRRSVLLDSYDSGRYVVNPEGDTLLWTRAGLFPTELRYVPELVPIMKNALWQPRVFRESVTINNNSGASDSGSDSEAEGSKTTGNASKTTGEASATADSAAGTTQKTGAPSGAGSGGGYHPRHRYRF